MPSRWKWGHWRLTSHCSRKLRLRLQEEIKTLQLLRTDGAVEAEVGPLAANEPFLQQVQQHRELGVDQHAVASRPQLGHLQVDKTVRRCTCNNRIVDWE